MFIVYILHNTFHVGPTQYLENLKELKINYELIRRTLYFEMHPNDQC